MSTALQLDTHEIFNQSPPYEDIDLFSTDAPLVDAVKANGAGGETAALSAFGRQWGTAEMFALGRRANENPPKLYTFNPKGFRRDVVEFHPAYHELMRASIAAGLHASTFTLQASAPRRRRRWRAPRATTWPPRSRAATSARSP